LSGIRNHRQIRADALLFHVPWLEHHIYCDTGDTLLLGGLGVHKFYLGSVGLGIACLLFCWTFIPAIIGFIEGLVILTMSEATFNE